jgi:hypothetical protein
MAGDERLERYRLNAEKCLTLAQRCNDRESKHALLGMAKAWLMAENGHSDYRDIALGGLRVRTKDSRCRVGA